MSTVTSIPQSQVHNTIVPAYVPDYNHISISPNQTRDVITLNTNTSTDTITFELSPEACMNLSKSYLDFTIEIEPGISSVDASDTDTNPWTLDPPIEAALDIGHDLYDCLLLRNTMNINTLKVYNKTGTLLCDLDSSYNEYRDLMQMIAQKYPQDFKGERYYKDVFDGMYVTSNLNETPIVMPQQLYLYGSEDMRKKELMGSDNCYIKKVAGKDWLYTKKYCRFHLGDLYNTILSNKSDIYFGESIYIQISFGSIINWLMSVKKTTEDDAYEEWHHITEYDGRWLNYVKMSIHNPKLYVAYNKSTDCNMNTIKYCTHHGIDFTDFNVVQVTKDPIRGDQTFNYNFTINSSIGPYVKFILYRAYVNDANNRSIVSFTKPDDRIRWQINDFVCTPDYLYVSKYQTWEYIYPIIRGSFFDISEYNYISDFFDILNFSTDSLTELKTRVGRDLSKDLKISYDVKNWNFDFDHYEKTIHHKFYIITGKMLILSARGVEKVV